MMFRRSSLPVLDTLRVASPCSADWEEMKGDDKRRFCAACEKHVYNLPELSPEELVDLIETTEGKFCGRLFQRTDGTVLTGDCPIGLSAKLAQVRRRRKMIGAAAAVTGLMFAAGAYVLGAAWGGSSISPMVAGDIAIVEPQPPVELGEIAPQK